MVALLTDTGKMVEWVKYSSYGVPFALPAGDDTDSDGDFDSTDLGNIGGTYDVREDVNLDGTVDTSDAQDALVINNGYVTLGRGALSNPVTANRKGYAGYEYDPTFEGAGRHLYHVRHRVYDADVGRWTRRDPLGYVDGMSLYGYTIGNPMAYADFSGWRACASASGLGSGSSDTDRTDQECCDAAKDAGLDRVVGNPNPSSGGLICCDGRLVPCAWHVPQPKYGRPLGPGNDRGRDHAAACIVEHENDHKDDVADCPPTGISRPNFVVDDGNQAECDAYRVEAECLERKRKDCETKYPAGSPDRKACMEWISWYQLDACYQLFIRGCTTTSACTKWQHPDRKRTITNPQSLPSPLDGIRDILRDPYRLKCEEFPHLPIDDPEPSWRYPIPDIGDPIRRAGRRMYR